MGVLRPDLIVKSTSSSKPGYNKLLLFSGDGSLTKSLIDIVPIVMAGIIGIYGLVVSVLVANDLTQKLPLYTGFIQLGAGLAVGLAGLAAG
jgi:F0F1-type ATP synthase membrane subunit c/vacuolar-type H+-ATPase subunit K